MSMSILELLFLPFDLVTLVLLITGYFAPSFFFGGGSKS